MNTKLAVTVITVIQISMDEYKDFYTTKVFDYAATIRQIDDWIKTIDKSANFHTAKISHVV